MSKPEIIKVTCDVHSWMRGWIAVLPHPYFGVTDSRGAARIEAVSVGRHTVEAWHEKLGRRTQEVTVQAGETARVVIEFPPSGQSRRRADWPLATTRCRLDDILSCSLPAHDCPRARPRGRHGGRGSRRACDRLASGLRG